MTAPLFLVAPGALDGAGPGDVVRITGEEAHHAVTVRRLAVGEEVIVADGDGQGALGQVESLDRSEATVRVTARRDEPAPSLRLVLVQALAKGGRDESAIEAATELGVDEVVPWQAQRSIVRWKGPKAGKGRDKWGHVVTAAAKQSRRARVPAVAEPVTTTELAERAGAEGTTCLVLHEDAEAPLATLALPTAGDLLLVVGPEGGIGADELGVLTAAGARPVRLGGAVLRSSTAGPAALAVVSSRIRWVSAPFAP